MLPPSSRQRKVEPVSLDEKSKVASVLVVKAPGPEPIAVSGGEPSVTVHVMLAGVGSMLPSTSTAWTRKVWVPTVSSHASPAALDTVPGGQSGGTNSTGSGTMNGERHSVKASPSSEHSNVASADGSLETKAMPTLRLEVVAGGPPTIVVSGALPTVKSHSAGISPAMPYSFTARTWNR